MIKHRLQLEEVPELSSVQERRKDQNLVRVEGAARKIQRQLDHQRSASAALCGNADAALSVFSGPEQI